VIDPRQVLSPAMDAAQKIVEQKIKIFGSANKA
jgi:fructose/tagatose bisphosphate aldolase